MIKRFTLLIVFAAIALTGCRSASQDSPPLAYLVTDSGLVDGFQSSYCWDQGVGAALCVDMIEPYFEQTTALPADAPIQFQLDAPLPDTVTVSISKEVFGDTILSANLTPADLVDWSPQVEPGEYILQVGATWPQGDVSYWFSVSLE